MLRFVPCHHHFPAVGLGQEAEPLCFQKKVAVDYLCIIHPFVCIFNDALASWYLAAQEDSASPRVRKFASKQLTRAYLSPANTSIQNRYPNHLLFLTCKPS